MEVSIADQIRELAAENVPVSAIIARVKCSRGYVYRVLGDYRHRLDVKARLDEIYRELVAFRVEMRELLGQRDIIQMRLKRLEAKALKS